MPGHADDENDARERDDQKDPDEKDERTIRQRLEGFVPDLVKRTFYAGLGAVFTTEEGIRKLASEFSLPKDVVTYLVSTAASTKDELFRVVAHEMRGFLEGLNLHQEMAKLLTTLSFEIKTEIRFIPNDEAVLKVKPDIRPKVTIKRNKPEGEGGGEG
jgi:hypothetical protein